MPLLLLLLSSLLLFVLLPLLLLLLSRPLPLRVLSVGLAGDVCDVGGAVAAGVAVVVVVDAIDVSFDVAAVGAGIVDMATSD
jgi:hypothetical protein